LGCITLLILSPLHSFKSKRTFAEISEGVDPARYFNRLGLAAFALKYWLAREEGSPYTIDNACEDAQRAMRPVRSHAKEWGIDPNRIGIMGFSAGGELTSMVTFGPTTGDPKATDPIDRVSCRPDFLIEIYPGPLGVPEIVPTNAPPAFFLGANDDVEPAQTITGMLEKYRQAGVPAEVHLFAKGSHAFNMGYRSKLATIKKLAAAPDGLDDGQQHSEPVGARAGRQIICAGVLPARKAFQQPGFSVAQWARVCLAARRATSRCNGADCSSFVFRAHPDGRTSAG
jgi:acetyl esterase/lipase